MSCQPHRLTPTCDWYAQGQCLLTPFGVILVFFVLSDNVYAIVGVNQVVHCRLFDQLKAIKSPKTKQNDSSKCLAEFADPLTEFVVFCSLLLPTEPSFPQKVK